MIYTNFEIAREQVRNLKIKTVKEYYEMFKNKQIPAGIPRNPNRDYSEFKGWPDFLGNNNIAAKDKIFYTYEECQSYLLNQGVDSKEKFEKWRKTKINDFVPSRPDVVYKKKWKSWGEFFKTGRVSDLEKHNSFLSYNDAKEFLKKFSFNNENEFYEWAKTKERPKNIPASPRKTYGKDFISMGDFLGNNNYSTKDWLPYEECKKFVQSFNFNSINEYSTWISKNKANVKVPAHPRDIYPEFEGWPEFIGYQRKVSVGEKTISSILVSNNIEHKLQYTIPQCKDVSVLPFDVAITEGDTLICLIEYHGVQHFLPIEFFGGEAALEQTQKRDEIKREYCAENKIPLLEITYQDNLEQKLSLFLDAFNIDLDLKLERKPALNKNFLSYNEARKIIKSMKFKSMKEFNANKEMIPFGIPHTPQLVYVNNGWVSWGDFLGTNKIQTKKASFVSFEEAKRWFKENGIKSGEHWRKLRKAKPNEIPSHPSKIYKGQWCGWKDFLS